MAKNVGRTDKITRLGVAVAAFILALVVGLDSVGGILLVLVALVMAVTALTGYCGIYKLFGMSTRSSDASKN